MSFFSLDNPEQRHIIMLDEMSIKECSEIESTNCTIDLSYLADSEFKNVDFVICMNPRLSNNQKLNIKYTVKGKLFNLCNFWISLHSLLGLKDFFLSKLNMMHVTYFEIPLVFFCRLERKVPFISLI